MNGLLEFYMKNNIQYKSLNESKVITKMLQISNEELNEMKIVHADEKPKTAAKVTSDQRNVRRPVIFEEAKDEDEELLVLQEEILLTFDESIEPVTTLEMASARVIDVQQLGNFVPFSDPNLFAKLFLIFSHLNMAIKGQSEK